MKFNCKVLDQNIVDDLIAVELSGANGFLKKQFGQFLIVSSNHLADLKSAIAKRDFEAAIEVAHKLGGLCGTLGASRVSRSCRELEIKVNDPSSSSLDQELENLFRLLEDAKAEVQVFLLDLDRSQANRRVLS